MCDLSLSVVLPTHSSDDPDALSAAIESIVSQTRLPEEVVVVKDGSLTNKLDAVVSEYGSEYPAIVDPLQLPKNHGLGGALRAGVEAASNDLVARQDADDISVSDRFEQQLSFLQENPNVDIVGGYIKEFDEEMTEPISIREVPTTHDEIRQMARFRCPMNHVTVMFRRDVAINAGNYRSVDRMEDYELWIRMILNDARFANIPEVLTNVRAGAEMYSRRGGWEYAYEEVRLQRELRRQNFISLPVFVFNIVSRTGLRLTPNRVRKVIYEWMARS